MKKMHMRFGVQRRDVIALQVCISLHGALFGPDILIDTTIPPFFVNDGEPLHVVGHRYEVL